MRLTTTAGEVVATEQGQNRTQALSQLSGKLREEVKGLVRAYTSDLTPEQRKRKQLLLGVVDVARLLGEEVPKTYYVYGEIKKESGRLYLDTGST